MATTELTASNTPRPIRQQTKGMQRYGNYPPVLIPADLEADVGRVIFCPLKSFRGGPSNELIHNNPDPGKYRAGRGPDSVKR